jgi:cyclopropane fatty-acyl-phospholipid synthase-like methyltransferase
MRKFVAFSLALAVACGMSQVPTLAQEKKDDKDKKDAKEPLKVEIEVPFVPTKEKVVAAMLKLANVKDGDTVYDLGCGDGRIAIAAVKGFKAKRGLGIDFNPDRLKDCDKRMKDLKLTADEIKKLTFRQGDVLKMKPEDFKDVDVVTLYLLQKVNDRLKPVLLEGLKPGARVVSHDFYMTDWKEDKKEEVDVEGDRAHTVYLWTIPEKKGK